MEKYVVVYKSFKDLKDNDYLYKKGDIYPREGLETTKKRIKELSTEKNKIGEPLIRQIEEEVEDTEKTEEIEKIEESEETTEEPTEEEVEDTEKNAEE